MSRSSVRKVAALDYALLLDMEWLSMQRSTSESRLSNASLQLSYLDVFVQILVLLLNFAIHLGPSWCHLQMPHPDAVRIFSRERERERERELTETVVLLFLVFLGGGGWGGRRRRGAYHEKKSVCVVGCLLWQKKGLNFLQTLYMW